jgi:cell volume regulation protein A
VMGLLAQYVFRRFKIPDALLLIAFGVLVSSLGLVDGVKQGSAQLDFLLVFSLIYVVFYGALPIRLKAVFSTMKFAFFSAFLNFIIIAGLVMLICKLFGFSWIVSFCLGALFSVLDGSIINAVLEIIKVGDKAEAQLQVESAIIDVLVIVSVLSVVNFAGSGMSDFFVGVSRYLFLSLGVGVVCAFIWVFLLRYVGSYSSVHIATMAVLVMVYALTEAVLGNGVIAVFSFSIVLGNVSLWTQMLYKKDKEKASALDVSSRNFFKDISFLVRTFLFVYLGILVDLGSWPYLLLGLAFFVIAYAVRSLICHFVVNKELKGKDLFFIEAMCAKGLTPIVLLAVVNADAVFANIVVGGVFFSVLISSVLVFLIEKGSFTSLENIIFNKSKKASS